MKDVQKAARSAGSMADYSVWSWAALLEHRTVVGWAHATAARRAAQKVERTAARKVAKTAMSMVAK